MVRKAEFERLRVRSGVNMAANIFVYNLQIKIENIIM